MAEVTEAKKRDTRLQLRLTSEEKAKIKKEADEHSMPMATYVRSVLLSKDKK